MRSRAAFSASEASAARDPPRPSRYFQPSRVHFLTGLPPNAPDSRRYALIDKVNKQAVAHEYRFRRNGKGFDTEERNTYKDPTEGEEARRKPPE